MFSSRKATSPAAAKSSSPNTTTARRLRQKATSDLNTAQGLESSVARRGFEQVAQEYPTFCHHQFAGLKTLENLITSLALQAESERPHVEMSSISGNPRDHRAVALAHGGGGGNRGAFDRAGEADDDSSQHARAQFALGIIHLRAHRYAVRARVDGRVHSGNPAEIPVTGKSRHRHPHSLTRVDVRALALRQVGEYPLSRSRRTRRIEASSFDQVVDSAIRYPEGTDCLASRFQRRRRGLLGGHGTLGLLRGDAVCLAERLNALQFPATRFPVRGGRKQGGLGLNDGRILVKADTANGFRLDGKLTGLDRFNSNGLQLGGGQLQRSGPRIDSWRSCCRRRIGSGRVDSVAADLEHRTADRSD